MSTKHGAGRIDVHHHLVPGWYAALLTERGVTPGGVPVPRWSAEKSLRLMRRNHIDSAVLSLSTPGVWFGDAPEARRLARRVNEDAAATAQAHPGRFGYFATLTLPDVEGAIAEADHALAHLDADGVVLLTNHAGTYIYEPAFEKLLAHLDALEAVVFLHPGELPGQAAPGIPSFTADFLLETVRAATGLVLSGAMDRYPRIRWILSHAGGFLPYISHRVLLTQLRTEPRLRQLRTILRPGSEVPKRLEVLQRFHYDVALSSTPAALPSLLAFADPSRVLYGSDYPFNPAPGVQYMAGQYERHRIPRRQRARIDRSNAERLFPRWAR